MEERISSDESLDKTVGQCVAEDYRTAKVFEKFGIDFCCGGMLTVGQACRERGIDPPELLREVESARQNPQDRSLNYGSWDLPFLADYIVNTHHAYLRENVDTIAGHTRRIAEVHGPNHPEVVEVAKIFGKMSRDLMNHLNEEEETLFPAVRRLAAARKEEAEPEARDVDLIRQTLQKLNREHEEVGEAVHEIRRVTHDYAIPEDACNTFRLTYRELKEFEDDLHKHVHLENNILFPKAASRAKE